MKTITYSVAIIGAITGLLSCHKDDMEEPMPYTFKVENVLSVQPFVETGTFKGAGAPPVILPGQAVSFTFSAGKGQTVSFATMYGWSNDLFFAPGNPGIALYDEGGKPVEGDVSSQIKLWDNGSKINQAPGMNNQHNSANQNGVIKEVSGMDAQGFSYLPTNKLVNAMLKYNNNSTFTLTIRNISGGTANETPLSPGVWAVSNYLDGALLTDKPLFTPGQPSANGLTPIAEMGDNSVMAAWLSQHTKVATGLSPVVVVVYEGGSNSHMEKKLFTAGQMDMGDGLADIAQEGNQATLVASLEKMPGVRKVYVLSPSNMPIRPGKSAEARIDVAPGDRIAFATMFGSSNDWFFAFDDKGLPVNSSGDLTDKVKLWDNGTEMNEYPGAGNHQPQFNPGSKNEENKPIMEVDRSKYATLPDVKDVIRVTFSK